MTEPTPETLPNEHYLVKCPRCGKYTDTRYTQEQIKFMQENPQEVSPLPIICSHCQDTFDLATIIIPKLAR